MVNATVQFVDGTGIRDMGRCLSVNAGRQLCCGQTLSIISTTSRPASSSSGGAGWKHQQWQEDGRRWIQRRCRVEASAAGGGGWSTLDSAAAPVEASAPGGWSTLDRVLSLSQKTVCLSPLVQPAADSSLPCCRTRDPASLLAVAVVPYVFGGDDDARPARRRPPVRGRILGSIIHPRVSTAARARRPAPLSHAPNVV